MQSQCKSRFRCVASRVQEVIFEAKARARASCDLARKVQINARTEIYDVYWFLRRSHAGVFLYVFENSFFRFIARH